MNSQKLANAILQLMEKKGDFYSFDIFLIEKMLGRDVRTELLDQDNADALRWEGWRELMQRLGGMEGGRQVASVQTMQKWFGIHGKTIPSREHIFRLGFALGLAEDEISEYLKRGIGEPDFQMNDYREVIFLYSCRHGMSYEEALDMIEEFEIEIPLDTEIRHHNYTDGMEENFRIKCDLERAEFLDWMLQLAGDFKGYSMTVLEYFRSYKREILREVKSDAKRQMNGFLKQTDFEEWIGNRPLSERKRMALIPRYFAAVTKRNAEAIPETLQRSILELLEMSRISEDSNSELLAELYADINYKYRNFKTSNTRDEDKKQMPLDVNLMNDKYLSQLLKQGIHMETSLRLTMLYSRLRALPMGTKCPQDAWQLLREYGYIGDHLVDESMLEWLEEKRKQKGRQCHVISRKDLLPLILCVAQKRYLKSVTGYHYQEEDAKKAFVSLANMTLSACHMEAFNPEKYEFDALLYLCYQPSELFFLSDVLEALAGVS